MPVMKTVVESYRFPCHIISVLVMTWSQNFSSRDNITFRQEGRDSCFYLVGPSSPRSGRLDGNWGSWPLFPYSEQRKTHLMMGMIPCLVVCAPIERHCFAGGSFSSWPSD